MISYHLYLFAFIAALADVDVQVDCASGAVDTASNLPSLTDAICISKCKQQCSSVSKDTEAEECLSSDDLLGCLFDITQLHTVRPKYCQTVSPNNEPVVVVQVQAEDITYFGTGDEIEQITLAMSLSNYDSFTNCSDHTLSLGISGESFDASQCKYSGTGTSTQRYGVSDGVLTAPVTDLFTGTFGSGQPVTIYSIFKDTSCGTPESLSANVIFSLKYKSGYRPSISCKDVDRCNSCLANGCNWCDWSSTVGTLLPQWLPDWEWIDSARKSKAGACGLNSAVCKASAGNVNTCGVTPSKFFGMIGVLSVAVIFLLSH